ncbi:MAG: hypothetical protein WCG07_00560 [Candidatus Taylorbacteria bacterium]
MKLEKKTLLQTVKEHDIEIIGGAWEEAMSLIEQNPFSERIGFLLNHQEIATTPVKNMENIISIPNCIGTAFFVAGVGTLAYPYRAYDFELNPHMVQAEGSKSIDMFRQHHERRIPGAFIFSYSAGQDDWHAGIYVGKIADEHISFAQHGHGGPFCLETVARNYCRPDYYIPSTLLKNQTLQML